MTTLKLQPFRDIKPTVSISLDSPSMMSLGDGFLNCPQPSYETQTELKKKKKKKKKEISMNISEDQLYEDMLKSGEVVL